METVGLDEAYRPLAQVYLAFLSIWFGAGCSWTLSMYRSTHFPTTDLHWTLASLPVIKVLQLALSFLFWYSCFYLQTCSLWMSFGAYVTGILFQTASFICFSLISQGYCIMFERLSISERRTTAVLGCAFYLTLVGYKAYVPQFTVLLLLNYLISFFLIFRHISQNLSVLREQLAFIVDENVQVMHDAVYSKYIMFKKFRGAMQIVAMAETMIYINVGGSSEDYWLRLLVREWGQFCIFLYIGWTFRSQDLAQHFSVVPDVKSKKRRLCLSFTVLRLVVFAFAIIVATLHLYLRIISMPSPLHIKLCEFQEMDAAAFKDFSSHEWHIGVPTSRTDNRSCKDSVLVIVEHPHRLPSDTASSSGPHQV